MDSAHAFDRQHYKRFSLYEAEDQRGWVKKKRSELRRFIRDWEYFARRDEGFHELPDHLMEMQEGHGFRLTKGVKDRPPAGALGTRQDSGP